MADKKENKYSFWKRQLSEQGKALVDAYVQRKRNMIYNLWMSKFIYNGLDEDQKEQQENYIMRKFWETGTIGVRKLSKIDKLVFMPWTKVESNLYDFPEVVNLVNKRNVAKTLIPAGNQIVNKDVVLIWAMPNHKPIEYLVNYYIERMAQVEIILNNNLKLQSMPYVIGCSEEDKAQLDDIVRRILNDDLVIFTGVNDITKLQTLITQVPFLVDKLRQHQVSLENEIYTILGINNSGVQQKKAQMLVDEVNSNNDSINDFANAIKTEIEKGFAQVERVFGRKITIKEIEPITESTEDFEDASISKGAKEKGDEEDE